MHRLLVSKTVVLTKQSGIYRRAVPVACVLLALCAGSWIAMGQAVFTEYTGTYKPVGVVSPGTVECPGGQPTGLWPSGPPCSPGSRVRIRGFVRQWDHQSTDPRVTGQLFVVINANFDGWPGSGPMWGTGRLEVTQGGVWEGSWTGERTVTGESVNSVTHGSGGNIEGLLNEAHASRSPSPWYVTGRILQPGGK